MENNYIELLDASIEEHKSKASWGEGLFETTEDARQQRKAAKYKKATRDFGAMMWSPTNDGSTTYLNWAMDKALGITPTKASYRKALYRKVRI